MQLLDDGTLVAEPERSHGLRRVRAPHAARARAPPAARSRRAKRDDPMLDVLSRRGIEHEDKLLGRSTPTRRRPSSRSSTPTAPAPRSTTRRSETLDAMRKGVDVIYQATFFDGRWRGHADFLLRVEHAERARRLVLRGRRRQARPPREGRRASCRCATYSEHARSASRASRRDHIHVITGDGERHTVPARRLLRLLPRAQGALRGARARRRPTDRTPTRSRSTTAASAAGSTCARDQSPRRRPPLPRRRHAPRPDPQARRRRRRARATALARRSRADPHVDGIGDAPLERLRHQAALQVASRGIDRRS